MHFHCHLSNLNILQSKF
uniref:Uncharacterized protein n=1 Tax=Arundo donax TaxID=35708 RepID=A0A0A9A7W5_ARUDO